MSDNFNNFYNGVNLRPLSATPTNPKEGDVFRSDGTVLAEGLHEYKGSTWQEIGGGGGGGTDIIAIRDADNDLYSDWDSTGITNAIWGTETSAPLSGDTSFKLTNHTSAVNEYVITDEITIDKRSTDKDMGVEIMYTYDGDVDDISAELYYSTDGTSFTACNRSTGLEAQDYSTRALVTGFIPNNAVEVELRVTIDVANNGKILIFDDIKFSDDPYTVAQVNIDAETETKLLTADVTSDGTITDLTFSNLEIGKEYEVSGQYLFYLNLGGVDTNVIIDCYHDSNIIARNYITEDTTSGVTSQAISCKFVATTATVTFEGLSLTVNSLLRGANNRIETFVQLSKVTNPVEHIVTPSNTPKTYSEANGDFTVSSTAGGWSLGIATMMPFKSQDGQWYANILISGTVTATSSVTLKVSDVIFQSTNALSHLFKDGLAYASDSTDEIIISTTANFTNLNIQGVVRLASKPTWASDVNTQYLSYVPKDQIAYIKDVKAATTEGGTFTSGAWYTRDLNTLSGDTEFISLSSNLFTLEKGVYNIEVSAPAFDVSNHKIKIVQDPSGTPSDLIIGSNAYSFATGNILTSALLEGQIEINSSTEFSIEHRCSTTQATNGFGAANGFGVDEIYTQVKITKVRS